MLRFSRENGIGSLKTNQGGQNMNKIFKMLKPKMDKNQFNPVDRYKCFYHIDTVEEMIALALPVSEIDVV